MQVLQGMDPDKMVVIFPAALIAIYFIISVQKRLCERWNPNIGLILPVACFVAATVLAFRPMFLAETAGSEGIFSFCLRMWFTFNIPTLVFLFPYYKQRKLNKAAIDEPSCEETCSESDESEDGNNPEA